LLQSGRPLRLLVAVEKPLGRAPHQRFRHEQWTPYLASDHGIELDFAPFESPALADLMDRPGRRAEKLVRGAAATARRWAQRHRARVYDGVVILRSASLLGGAWYERYLRASGIPYIFDFDDAIWEPAPGWTRHLWRSEARVPESIRLAAAVTAGNTYLADYARRFNPDVTVIPTSIDLAQYVRQPARPPASDFRVLWIGSAATLQYLDTIMPALRVLAQRIPLALRVVYNGPAREHSGLRVEYSRWSAATELRDLADCDVGIMPLPDTPFSRGKCGLKALQYMAVERAAVVSPVGVNRDIIRDGENGLWASTHDEWVARLEFLARDVAVRARLAAAGRDTVEREYSATIVAAKFASVARAVFTTARPAQ
jgi:glycosyltransferase involved in cell wall biosynthesis